jgi:uncharacterized protein involved in exopolysaccharide biosynthesis
VPVGSMSASHAPPDGELTVFAVATMLLRHRWRVIRWTAGCGAIALASVIMRPPQFRAVASFAPQGSDASKSNLASLAGQFGVSIPASGQSQSPEYYARVLKSRSLLLSVVRDTFQVAELGAQRVALLDLFEIRGANQALREDVGLEQLTRMIGTAVSKPTGIVEVTVQTKWRSVSLAIVSALVARLNDFNQRSRQTQAGAERRFVEGRLAAADSDLRSAEDNLRQFVRSNRQVSNSPDLTLERDRLDRLVSQRQQVYTTLTQSFEEARIREVRDTPVISLVESPSVPARSEPRGRTKVLVLGILLGAFVGGVLVLISGTMARRRADGDTEVTEFASALGDATSGLVTPLRRISGRSQR